MCCVCANVEKKKHGTLVAYYTFFFSLAGNFRVFFLSFSVVSI